MDRRSFSKKMIRTTASVLFLETLFGCSSGPGNQITETNGIIAPKAVTKLNHWAIRLDEYCNDLDKNLLTVVEWQDMLGSLFENIEIDELLRFIEIEKLAEQIPLPDLGVATRAARFPRLEGLPEKTVYVKKVFGMKPGRAIIPHGHSNMASGHLIIKGRFDLRQYDKIEKERHSLLVKQTIEKDISVGEFSSISDERDNVHWFVAGNRPAFTFDVIMLDLKGKRYEIHNLDMDFAEKAGDGYLRAPVLNVQAALAKYGKLHHTGGK